VNYEFTKEQIVDYVQRAIHDRSGDDLERARAAFRNRTPEQMQLKYGQSDRTCQEILDGYVKERALATAAMAHIVKEEAA
jgi:hypothetical protein